MSKRRPRTPKQAAAREGPIDAVLDPVLFASLADSTRVRLVGCLAKCGRACSVSEVAACCAVDFSVVSRHLKVLERAGVVSSSRQGRVVLYEVRYREVGRAFRRLAAAIEGCDPGESDARCAGGCCG